MTPFDRLVRSRIYALFAGGSFPVDVATLARSGGWPRVDVAGSLNRLADEHRVAVNGDRVWMAHPFSGVPTEYRAVIDDRSWFANCAWDTLAVLAMLGEGVAVGPDGLSWEVADGMVLSDGLVHLLVPARDFWEDIGFT